MSYQTGTSKPSLGVIIRFRNASATLPAVLDALSDQSVRPDLILGVDNQSTDASASLLQSHGARLLDWPQQYNHSKVLNYALSQCPTDLVLVLSAHTVLHSPTTISDMLNAMSDPNTACVSGKWDDDPFYSDAITWKELQHKGLKFGSIYSNSFGMIRRAVWAESPFDESLVGMEDYAWAIEQLKRGYLCRRIKFPFTYNRVGALRHGFFAAMTFKLASRYGLQTTWLGIRLTSSGFLRGLLKKLASGKTDPELDVHRQRLWAWMSWRWRPIHHE